MPQYHYATNDKRKPRGHFEVACYLYDTKKMNDRSGGQHVPAIFINNPLPNVMEKKLSDLEVEILRLSLDLLWGTYKVQCKKMRNTDYCANTRRDKKLTE